MPYQISIAVFLLFISVICGSVGGYLLHDSFSKKAIEKKIITLRPDVTIDFNYFDKNKIGIIIRTGDNKEIIEKLIVSFVVEGIVLKAYPRGNIINSTPPNIQISPFFSVNTPSGNFPVLDKVIIECDNIRDSVLNGAVIEYKTTNEKIDFNKDISVEWYWKYSGETKKENKYITRNNKT